MTDKFPLGALMEKGLQVRTGQTHVQRYTKDLLEKIEDGTLDTTFLISHRLPLEDAARGEQQPVDAAGPPAARRQLRQRRHSRVSIEGGGVFALLRREADGREGRLVVSMSQAHVHRRPARVRQEELLQGLGREMAAASRRHVRRERAPDDEVGPLSHEVVAEARGFRD